MNLRVLLIGGGGFLGAWIARRLAAVGARLRIFDLAPAPPIFRAVADDLVDAIDWRVGDVVDAAAVREAADGCDAIIALAASSGGEAATRDIWGGKIGWLAWKRPGYTLGVMLRKRRLAREVMQPRIRREITRSGSRLLPMFSFLALALGFLVVGQAVTQLSSIGATNYVGSLMVTVVVRELAQS